MIVLCIIAIGFSAAAQLLGTSVLWGNLHSGTPAMVQRLAIQAFVSMGALGWVVMTPFRWRTQTLEIGGLAAVAAGQLSVWELLLHHDVGREWTVGPIVLLSIAVISLLLGFGVFLVRPSLDWSTSD